MTRDTATQVQQAPAVLSQEQEQEAKLRARYGGLVPKKGLLPLSRKARAATGKGHSPRQPGCAVRLPRPHLTLRVLSPPVPVAHQAEPTYFDSADWALSKVRGSVGRACGGGLIQRNARQEMHGLRAVASCD